MDPFAGIWHSLADHSSSGPGISELATLEEIIRFENGKYDEVTSALNLQSFPTATHGVMYDF